MEQKDENKIWLGIYDTLQINDNFNELIEKCKDKSKPKEIISLKLEKYQLNFSKNTAFITFNENKFILITLYLITKEQLIDILVQKYNCNDNSLSLEKINLKNLNEELNLDNNNCYNLLLCLGKYKGVNILSITVKNNNNLIENPDNVFLNNYYISLKRNFKFYDDYFIIYYLYLSTKNFDLKELLKILNVNKEKEITNFNKNESNLKEYDYILELKNLPDFDKTTGEFFWNNTDTNWEKVNESLKNNKDIEKNVINIKNGSLSELANDLEENTKDKDEINDNMLKYEDELNNILKRLG